MANAQTYNWTAEDAALQGRVDTLKNVDESDNSFARRCGLDPGNLTKFRQHKISLGPTYLRRIAAACKVSYAWLKEGIGDRDDINGLIDEPLPDRNRVYRGYHVESDSPSDALTIELLKAENNALHKVIDNISSTLDILQKTLEQNNKILSQNGEALAQNRALMQFINEVLKK